MNLSAYKRYLGNCRKADERSQPYAVSGRLTRINGLVMEGAGLKLALSGNLEGQPYYEVPLDTRIHYGVMYLGLAAFLAVMSYDLHEMIGRY